MRRYELRFGLLGPPVLYDRPPYEISYDPASEAVPASTAPGTAGKVPGETPDGSGTGPVFPRPTML